MWCRKKIFFLFFSIFRTRMKVKHQIFFLFFVYLVLWRVFEKFISVFFQPAKKKRIFLEFFTNLKLRNNNLFSCIKKNTKRNENEFHTNMLFFLFSFYNNSRWTTEYENWVSHWTLLYMQATARFSKFINKPIPMHAL